MADRTKPEILITGAGGALAGQVIQKMKQLYSIIAVDFKGKVQPEEGVVFYHLDFSKRGFEEVFRKHDIKGVIHLGRILLYEWNRYRRYNTNVLGTQQLLDLSLKYGVDRVIVLSTFYVYGAHPYNPSLIDETFPPKAACTSANLADSVELDYLASIYMLKYPQLNISILRPCNIVGPGIKNSVNLLLQRKYVPCLLGFSPMMQFIHAEDLANAIMLAYEQEHTGIYNVASNDCVPYLKAVESSGGFPVPILSLPPQLPLKIVRMLNIREFPDFLLEHYKYPVILDGALFRKTFGFEPQHTLKDIFFILQRIEIIDG